MQDKQKKKKKQRHQQTLLFNRFRFVFKLANKTKLHWKKKQTGSFLFAIRKITSLYTLSFFTNAFASLQADKIIHHQTKQKHEKKFNKGAGSLFLFIPFSDLVLFCFVALPTYIQTFIAAHPSHPFTFMHSSLDFIHMLCFHFSSAFFL